MLYNSAFYILFRAIKFTKFGYTSRFPDNAFVFASLTALTYFISLIILSTATIIENCTTYNLIEFSWIFSVLIWGGSTLYYYHKNRYERIIELYDAKSKKFKIRALVVTALFCIGSTSMFFIVGITS